MRIYTARKHGACKKPPKNIQQIWRKKKNGRNRNAITIKWPTPIFGSAGRKKEYMAAHAPRGGKLPCLQDPGGRPGPKKGHRARDKGRTICNRRAESMRCVEMAKCAPTLTPYAVRSGPRLGVWSGETFGLSVDLLCWGVFGMVGSSVVMSCLFEGMY